MMRQRHMTKLGQASLHRHIRSHTPEAETAVRMEGLTNVELHKMDAEHLEFPDQSFDAVTCAFALFFFPDIEAALREMYRVCKPGGCLAITYFNKTPPPFSPGFPILIQQLMAYRVGVQTPQPLSYTPQEVEALLNRLGFPLIEIYNEITDIVYKSGEEWWSFLLTLASRASIMGMNEEVRARFKEEYLAKLNPMFSRDRPAPENSSLQGIIKGIESLAGVLLHHLGQPLAVDLVLLLQRSVRL